MEQDSIGKLILRLRREKGLTQRELAEELHVTDKTVSKWECGQGWPDVSLFPALSAALNVRVDSLLAGKLSPNSADGGNMKKVRFYVCPTCGNILTSTGPAEPACCGRRLEPLTPRPCDEAHRLTFERLDGQLYVTFSHEMTKEHYLRFVAYVDWDRLLLVRLYPEQGGELSLPELHGGRFYIGCSRDGLWVSDPV